MEVAEKNLNQKTNPEQNLVNLLDRVRVEKLKILDLQLDEECWLNIQDLEMLKSYFGCEIMEQPEEDIDLDRSEDMAELYVLIDKIIEWLLSGKKIQDLKAKFLWLIDALEDELHNIADEIKQDKKSFNPEERLIYAGLYDFLLHSLASLYAVFPEYPRDEKLMKNRKLKAATKRWMNE